MKKLNKKGFTLIEMLVVIAIIAILVAIIVPTVSNSTKKSQYAVDAANLRSKTAEAAIDYLADNELNAEYKMKVKSNKDAEQTIKFYIVNDALVGTITIDNNEYTVEALAKGAEEGTLGAEATNLGTALTVKTPKTQTN